jgi:enoyl-CoA hydratase/carnithine racemase
MSEIIVESIDYIETWTLNGEAKRNAVSVALLAEMISNVARVSSNKNVRCVVLRGAGEKAFCAGADLKERAHMSETQVRTFLLDLRKALRALELSDCVFIAYINGSAFGGGTELALACDIRLISATAEMGLTEVKLGIIPGGGGTVRLPRIIGISAAKEMILTGQKVNAEKAVQLKLATRVCTFAEAISLAHEISVNGPIAVSLAKHAIDEAALLPIDSALELEFQKYQFTMGTQDRLEGLKAFAEKRVPKFEGK